MNVVTDSQFMLRRSSAWVPDAGHAKLLTALVWFLALLMILPEGLDYDRLANSHAPESGSAISRLLWLFLFLFSGVAILWRSRLAWQVLRCLNPYLIGFLVLAGASVLWSIDPALSLRRLFRLTAIVSACLAFTLYKWHLRRFQDALRPLITYVLVTSLVFGLWSPTLAIHQEQSAELLGAWHGLFSHKNGFGAFGCLGALFWLHAWLSGETRWKNAGLGVGISVTCILLSRSSTALVATILVSVFFLFTIRAKPATQRWLPVAIVGITIATLVVALAVINVIPGLSVLLAPVTALTGKDNSLTGRTEIWSIVLEHIQQHELLGTGYGAYWRPVASVYADSGIFLARMRSFYPGSAHNGYLDITNDLGCVGLLVLIAFLISHVFRSLRSARRQWPQSMLHLGIFFEQCVTNLSESHWFNSTSVFLVVVTMSSISLSRSEVQERFENAYL